jgi:tetratricopeptide (TPR) repeat protein
MGIADQGLAEIVRDFAQAHQLMRRVIARYRAGELEFEQLQEMVGDDESSVLYRLKERCHALFRTGRNETGLANHREALFDLAVGSLFHEAMKFRESFYQREVYGPKVRSLRSEADPDAAQLFEEFEKILEVVSRRLQEGLHEAESLLDQTVQQLRVLLVVHPENGFVSRFLVESEPLVEEIFSVSLDALFAEIHGSAAEGFSAAGRSYLLSGYYGEAIDAFAAARERGGDTAELERLTAYARGMTAYLGRDYAQSVAHLTEWAEVARDDPPELYRLAQDAVSRVGSFAIGDERVERAAAALLDRLAQP